MKLRLPLLFILALGIWIGAFFWPVDKTKGQLDRNWPTLTAEQTKEIRLRNDKAEFVITRGNGTASLQMNGTTYPADAAKVAGLVDFVNANTPERRLGDIDKSQLKDYGLDPGRGQLVIPSPDLFIIRLGDDNPTHNGVYAVSSRESQLLLLPLSYVEEFLHEPGFYQDKRLLHVDKDAIETVRVEGQADSYELRVTRPGGGAEPSYAFTWPEQLTGLTLDPTASSFLLHSLSTAAASEILPSDQPASLPPRTARIELTLAGGNGTKPFIDLYKAQGNATLVGTSSFQPSAFLIGQRDAGNLLKTVFELKDRSVARFDTEQVKRQHIVSQAGRHRELTAVKTKDGWVPEGGKDQIPGLDMLAWSLNDLKYEVEPSQALPDTAEPALSWELAPESGEPLVKVRFFTDSALPPERVWLQIVGDSTYYPVDGQLLEDIRSKLPQETAARADNATAAVSGTPEPKE